MLSCPPRLFTTFNLQADAPADAPLSAAASATAASTAASGAGPSAPSSSAAPGLAPWVGLGQNRRKRGRPAEQTALRTSNPKMYNKVGGGAPWLR